MALPLAVSHHQPFRSARFAVFDPGLNYSPSLVMFCFFWNSGSDLRCVICAKFHILSCFFSRTHHYLGILTSSISIVTPPFTGFFSLFPMNHFLHSYDHVTPPFNLFSPVPFFGLAHFCCSTLFPYHFLSWLPFFFLSPLFASNPPFFFFSQVPGWCLTAGVLHDFSPFWLALFQVFKTKRCALLTPDDRFPPKPFFGSVFG